MRKYVFTFIFVLSFSFFALSTQLLQAQVNVSDSLELVRFYELNNGEDWFINDGWLEQDVKEWSGIFLDEEGKRVEEIHLSLFLDNIIFPEDWNLPELKGLGIQALSTNIPDFSHLPKLETLNLLGGSTDEIPDFSNLPNLEVLNFYGNNSLNEVPDFSNLPNLKELGISDGNWPVNPGNWRIPNFSNLPNLQSLGFSGIKGTIPKFTNLPSLESLSVRRAEISGGMPDFILPNLKRLDISYNQWNDTIPNFAHLPNLESLNLSLNGLAGPLPDFAHLPNLTKINLESNNFTGTIPDFPNLNNLLDLNLSQNQLTGPLPNFSGLSKVRSLYLNYNHIDGTFPSFSEMPKLERLYLGNNEIEGNLPDLSDLVQLSLLSLRHNKIESLTNITTLPRLSALDLSYNELNEPLPDLNLPHLIFLNLEHNKLYGEIPDFSHPTSVQTVRLSNNELSGEIPNFTYLGNLYILGLANNKLNGRIPDFSNIPDLETLSLQGNELNGEIPDFSNLPKLSFMYLNDNQLAGRVPDFSNSPYLQTLHLQNNELNGNVTNFSNLPNLLTLYLQNNNFSGNIPYFGKLTAINDLDISNNQITGELHSFPHNLRLVSINLSNNQFTGQVPVFSSLDRLVNADLSGNQFGGKLPNFTNNVKKSITFNLSNNILSFDGLEANIGYFHKLIYTPQACIDLLHYDSILTVSAGGTPNNNTYTWFKNWLPIAQNIGDSTLTITETGVYNCEITNSIANDLTLCTDYIYISTLATCQETSTCVWPGDTDADGTVSKQDLFYIGHSYDNTGIARLAPTIEWQAQACPDWEAYLPNEQNQKHADCNGDGTINQQDIQALYRNYQQTHAKTNVQSPQQATGIPLFAVHETTIIDSTEHIFSIHLGEEDKPAEDVYFLAFTIHFRTADVELQIGQPYLDFSQSWLQQDGDNIITFDTLFQHSATEWSWDIAISRTSQTNITGFGEVCRVGCIMDVVAIEKTNNKNDSVPLSIITDQVALLTYDATFLPIDVPESQQAVIVPNDFATSINNLTQLSDIELQIYPNPTPSNRNVMIRHASKQSAQIYLYDIFGKVYLRKQSKMGEKYLLSLPQLSKGLYFLQILDEENSLLATQKLMIIE